VAAAAVAVIAAAGGAVATRGFGGGQSGSAASSTDRVASESAGIAAPRPASSPPATSLRGSGKAAAVPLWQLSSRTFARDVRRVVAAGPGAHPAPQGTVRDLPVLPRPDDVPCGSPNVPRSAELVAVRLDGKPATLVVGPVKNGRRVAQVYSCDQPPVSLRTIRVPAAG